MNVGTTTTRATTTTTAPTATTTAATITTTSAPPAPAQTERAEALAVNAVLVESGSDRNRLRAAVAALGSCTDVPSQAQVMNALAASRRQLLTRTEGLDFHSLPGGAALKAVLVRALTSSVQADQDLAAWANDLARTGCSPGNTTNDPNYQSATAPDNAAESEKGEFAQMWDPIAKQFSLPAQTDNSF